MLTQLREDMIPMMDGLKEYLGMIHKLPDFVQISRVRTLALHTPYDRQRYCFIQPGVCLAL